MFEIGEKIEGNMAVLTLSGAMLDSEAMALGNAVKNLVSQDIKQIVLELGRVNMMNSCFGLGIVMACWGCANRSGGKLILANPSPKVSRLLSITKLDQVLEVFETVEQARGSLG
jgi:anti-anti-sigma factor